MFGKIFLNPRKPPTMQCTKYTKTQVLSCPHISVFRQEHADWKLVHSHIQSKYGNMRTRQKPYSGVFYTMMASFFCGITPLGLTIYTISALLQFRILFFLCLSWRRSFTLVPLDVLYRILWFRHQNTQTNV